MRVPPTPSRHLARRLPRLHASAYQGHCCVHWVMTMDQRRNGWLNDFLHLRLREVLLHVCVRYHLACAVYTLMPDHAHFLLLGMAGDSDQRLGVAYFRRLWNRILPEGFVLQRQAYDHVLREEERAKDAFAAVAWYILENPVRKNLVEKVEEWPFSGCLVHGFATLDPQNPNFWDWFWKAVSERREMISPNATPRDVAERR